MSTKKLYLATGDEQKIFGVCGGLGEYFEIDPTVVRLAVIFGTIVTGFIPGIVCYILAAVVMPNKPKKE